MRHDVPRHACYTGRYGHTYVWVMPEQIEMLTRLTLAILDIHTFKSERIGGLACSPGCRRGTEPRGHAARFPTAGAARGRAGGHGPDHCPGPLPRK